MIPCGKLWSGHDLIVTVRLPDQKPRVVHLNQPFARIGAHPKADIRLPDETRSLRALYLHATEEGIFCLNLDPTAGPRSTTRWLGPGRSAQVGPVVVEAAFADEPKRLLRAHGDLRLCQLSQAAAAPIQVRIANQDQTAALKYCRSPLTLVGRDKPSVIRLIHPMVSKTHCVLYWHEGELWAVDLLSANRTLLEGKAITAAQLQPGQELRLGNVSLVYSGVPGNELVEPVTVAPSPAAVSIAPHIERTGFRRHRFSIPPASAGAPPQVAASPSPELHTPPLDLQGERLLQHAAELADVRSKHAAELAEFGSALADAHARGEAARAARESLETENARLQQTIEKWQKTGEEQARHQAESAVRLGELAQQRDELLEHSRELTTRVEQSESRHHGLLSELEAERFRRLEMLREQAQLKSQWESSQQAQAQMAAELVDSRQNAAGLREETIDLHRRLAGLSQSLDCRRLISQLSEQYRQECESQLLLLNNEIAALRSAESCREAKLQESQSLAQQQQRQCEQRAREVEELEHARRQSFGRESALQSHLAEATARAETLAGELQTHRDCLTEQDLNRVRLESLLAEQSEEIVKLKHLQTQADAECRQKQAANEQLQALQATLTEAQQSARQRAAELQEQLQSLNLALEQSRRRETDLQTRLEQLQVEQRQLLKLTEREQPSAVPVQPGEREFQWSPLSPARAATWPSRAAIAPAISTAIAGTQTNLPRVGITDVMPQTITISPSQPSTRSHSKGMLSNAEPRVKSDSSETAAACQDDDLVTRLMIYQSRNLAAQRRRRILTSVGLAAAALAASVAAWQSWGTYWSFG